jgi:hypothetical protein
LQPFPGLKAFRPHAQSRCLHPPPPTCPPPPSHCRGTSQTLYAAIVDPVNLYDNPMVDLVPHSPSHVHTLLDLDR